VNSEDQKITASPVQNGVRRRSKMLVLSAGVIIAGVITGGIIYSHVTKIAPPNQPSRPAQTAEEKTYNSANELSLSGKPDEAQKSLDLQIQQEKDVIAEGRLYEFKASIALDAEDNQAALGFAQKAESLAPTRNSAFLIASAAEVVGDKAQAIKYYKIVITRTDPKVDTYTIPGLERKVKALEGSNG